MIYTGRTGFIIILVLMFFWPLSVTAKSLIIDQHQIVQVGERRQRLFKVKAPENK
jgi:hypothetical protein